jgi:hypothetical protein
MASTPSERRAAIGELAAGARNEKRRRKRRFHLPLEGGGRAPKAIGRGCSPSLCRATPPRIASRSDPPPEGEGGAPLHAVARSPLRPEGPAPSPANRGGPARGAAGGALAAGPGEPTRRSGEDRTRTAAIGRSPRRTARMVRSPIVSERTPVFRRALDVSGGRRRRRSGR